MTPNFQLILLVHINSHILAGEYFQNNIPIEKLPIETFWKFTPNFLGICDPSYGQDAIASL